MTSIAQNQSKLRQFLASIATIRGDLSNITAPPFVLASKSAVEFPAAWAEHPSILVAPAAEDDPQKRALLVLKWYLSSLKRQQYAGASEEDGIKKPLNAFLGELFIASFEDEAGTTKIISEQVSHHPPVTACHLWNVQHGVRAEGYTAQRITLSHSATVQIEQIGHAIVHIDGRDEAHLVTLPTLTVKGLLTGAPYPELVGTSYISSSAGLTTRIDYSGRGWLAGGRKNAFHAAVYRAAAPDDVLYTAEGHWNDTFTFRDGRSGEALETYDTHAARPTPITVGAVDVQDPWESRRAWAGVIAALKAGDMQKTADEKSKVEEAQRQLRKREEAEGKAWKQAMFSSQDGDALFEKLAKPIGEELRQDQTKGVWKFDEEKARKAEAPYHGELTPLG